MGDIEGGVVCRESDLFEGTLTGLGITMGEVVEGDTEAEGGWKGVGVVDVGGVGGVEEG